MAQVAEVSESAVLEVFKHLNEVSDFIASVRRRVCEKDDQFFTKKVPEDKLGNDSELPKNPIAVFDNLHKVLTDISGDVKIINNFVKQI